MDAAETHPGYLSQCSTILSVKMYFPNVSPTSSVTQLKPSLSSLLYFKMVSMCCLSFLFFSFFFFPRLVILEFSFTGQFSWSSDNFWCSILDGSMYHFVAYWRCNNNQIPKNDPCSLLTGWLPQLNKSSQI